MSDASTTEVPAAEPAPPHGEPHSGHPAGPGPINPMAWGAGLFGIVLGLVVAACLAIATGYLG